jgi:hypothetical protein
MYLAARACISWDFGPGGGVITRGRLLTLTLAQFWLYMDIPPAQWGELNGGTLAGTG